MQPIVLFCFLLSGISGLTLEVVWTRMLEHVFGATTLAISTVLTCFMGGLALGSWLFGRFGDRLKNPLRTYAIAEGIVGGMAFVIPVLIHEFYPDLNRWMVANLSNDFWIMSVVRFGAVAGVLLIPTTCMGATLPLLSRYVMTQNVMLARVGSRVGMLYTVNTIGAVLGVFMTTFLLLPHAGLTIANQVAGTINLCLCLGLIAMGRYLTNSKEIKRDDSKADLYSLLHADDSGPARFSSLERTAAMGAFFLSGLASMNLQIVWNRAMAMIIGASVYSFSLVLIAFLVGLALGSAVFSKLSKRLAHPVLALALVELGIALSAMLNYFYMDDLPRVFATLVTTNITTLVDNVAPVQFLMFSVAALAVLPATFFMGATFPLTIRIVSTGLGRVARDVGGVYALNTVGAIFGSFLSAFVFVPLFSETLEGKGMQGTFFLSVGIYGALAATLFAISKVRLAYRTLSPVAVLGLTALFITGVPHWDPAALTIGLYRLSLMKDALDEETWGDPDIKYYYDGVSTTVSLELWGRHFALKNNGKVDASNGDDMPTQIMVAAYPLLFHEKGPEGLDVAIIGFGSGVTVGSALEFPVKHVDTVELENAVIEASRVFGNMEDEEIDPEFNVNHLLYRSPFRSDNGDKNPEFHWRNPDTFVINERLSIFNNDGRNFLASSPKKYDVIVSEPSNPWITGVANMFTQENFASSVQALKKGGLFCQWVQLYELSPENIKTIFRTFAEVFPHVALFSAEDLSSDTMLLGSFSPIRFDLALIGKAMENPRVKAELGRAYVFSPTDVFARALLVNREELISYTNGTKTDPQGKLPINTDDNALIEFAAPRDLITFSRFAGYLATIYTDQWAYGNLDTVVEGFGEGTTKAENLAGQAISLLKNGRKRQAARFLELADEVDEDNPEVELAWKMVRLLRGYESAPLPQIEEPGFTDEMPESQRAALARQFVDIKELIEAKDFKTALRRFADMPSHLWLRGGPQLLLLKGYLHFRNADPEDTTQCEESIETLSQLVRQHESYLALHPESYYYLALCHDNALNFDKAVKNIRTYVELENKREEKNRIALAQAKANLEAMLSGTQGTMPIELPQDAPGLPTTDGTGESPKEMRQ